MMKPTLGTLATTALAFAFVAQMGCSKDEKANGSTESESPAQPAGKKSATDQANDQAAKTNPTADEEKEAAPKLLALKFHHDD